jgi:hypothetical protein
MGYAPTGLRGMAVVVKFAVIRSPFCSPRTVPVKAGFFAPYGRVALFVVTVRGACATESAAKAEEEAKLPWPAKLAVSAWLPEFKMPRLKTAEPLDRAVVEVVLPSTISATVPVTVPRDELTETVTLAGLP